MNKDNNLNINEDLASQMLQNEINHYLENDDVANQTIHTLITMIEVSQDNLHQHEYARVFRLISFLNTIQLLQAHKVPA